jgi:hypothetical protein
MGYRYLEDEQGNGDREDAVGEGFEAAGAGMRVLYVDGRDAPAI